MRITKVQIDEKNEKITHIYYVDSNNLDNNHHNNKNETNLSENQNLNENENLNEGYLKSEIKEITINTEVYFKRNIKVNDVYDEEYLKEILEEDSLIKAKNTILKMFNIKLRTEKEVVEKLKKDGFSHFVIDKAILSMKEYSIIDDSDYTKKYIKEKIRQNGKNKIIQDLLKKGISKETVLDRFDNETKSNEYDACFRLAQKKFKLLNDKEDDKRKVREKLYRYLISKGYEYDLIKKVSNIVLNSYEEDF